MTEHRARKRFGQNFLHDPAIISRIGRAIHAKADQHLMEIGPGQGALTSLLMESGARLDAVELDRDLVPILQGLFGDNPRFALHQGDALKFDISTLSQEPRGLRVVGNLPYNISTPLMFHLFEQQQLIDDMHFMLQLEVVQRLAAKPGSKTYGRLGVMAQYYCKVDQLFEVPPGAFNPPPKVQSAIVRLTPHRELTHPAKSVKLLQRVVSAAFNQRRKTLRNSLKELVTAEQLEQLGINPMLRPEVIELAQFVAIADAVFDNQSSESQTP